MSAQSDTGPPPARAPMTPGSLPTLAAALLLAAAAPAVAGDPSCRGASWFDADGLFTSSDRWLGADSAFSVDLGGQRTLWLFGDSWINASGRGGREQATMIRNSVGLQRGADPSRSGIEFYWDDSSESAAAFFASPPDRWYWPGHGVRLGDKVLVFLNRMSAAPGDGLGFRSTGWDAVYFENVDDEPSEWRVLRRHTGFDHQGIQLGFASVLLLDGYLYAFGTPDADKSHPVHAARWPVEFAERGDLSAPEWWTGAETGWSSDVSAHRSQPIFEGGQAELSIYYDAGLAEFIAVQSVGFGDRVYLGIRRAERLTGPWSSPVEVYRPPEFGRRNAMIYAGKAHPQLKGAELVLSYATNSFDFAEHFSDPSIYYPRFVRVSCH